MAIQIEPYRSEFTEYLVYQKVVEWSGSFCRNEINAENLHREVIADLKSRGYFFVAKKADMIVGYINVKCEPDANRWAGWFGVKRDNLDCFAALYNTVLKTIKDDKHTQKWLHIEVRERDQDLLQSLLEVQSQKLLRTYLYMQLREENFPLYVEVEAWNLLKKQKLSVTKANLNDSHILADLQNETFDEHFGYQRTTVQSIRNSLTQSPNSVLIAKRQSDNKAVAYFNGVRRADSDPRPSRVNMIGVLKQMRGSGVGKSLFAIGVANMLLSNPVVIELEVDSDNFAGVRAYQKSGFVEVEKIHWYGTPIL